MANHVRCRLISDTNVLKFIKSTHNNELIDFSMVIAMPVPFEITQDAVNAFQQLWIICVSGMIRILLYHLHTKIL